MNVRDFMHWLETQDQDATVEILIGVRGRGWDGDSYRHADFDPEKNVEYTDMRGNQHAVGKPYENSRWLFLGSAD